MAKRNERHNSRDITSSTSNLSFAEKNVFNSKHNTDMNKSSVENVLSPLSSHEKNKTKIADYNILNETSVEIYKIDDSNHEETVCNEIFNEMSSNSNFSEHLEKKTERSFSIAPRIRDKIPVPTENDISIQVLRNDDRPKENNCQQKDHLTPTVKTLKIAYLHKSKNRKRKWISRKITEILSPILSISTDSLKKLVSEVKPVPASDIHLDSSSEVEEVCTQVEKSSKNFVGKAYGEIPFLEKENFLPRRNLNLSENGKEPSIRSPTPSKNKETNVLYITNLVRPFTVLQLKGLLARTGKIIDNGFWIDRIKSRCFVQYETEDEAIETRHALHGIRWPNSNPKCLNVDFGRIEDMQNADHMMNKNEDDMNTMFKNDKILPVREWDVGKSKNLDGTRKEKVMRIRRNVHEEQSFSKTNDCNDNVQYFNKETSYISNSPVRKQRIRENDPPLRLLDDLFRKTQTTPCVYWLPLTPEQIAERETIRRQRVKERHQRINQKDREGLKSYEIEKEISDEIKEHEGECVLERHSVRRVSRGRDKRWI